jgi:hypothetical protein
MEEIIISGKLFSYIISGLAIIFMIYAFILFGGLYKHKYIPNYPMFISALLICICYIIQICLNFKILSIIALFIWIFNCLYWYRISKSQIMSKRIYQFLYNE